MWAWRYLPPFSLRLGHLVGFERNHRLVAGTGRHREARNPWFLIAGVDSDRYDIVMYRFFYSR